MVVDDAPSMLKLLGCHLAEMGYEVVTITTGEGALAEAEANPPDLILLDVGLPGMDGYEVCQRLKDRAGLRDLPVIFISAHGKALDKVKAFQVGGVDYVTKPFEFAEVDARIEAHLRIHRLQMELEQYNLHLQEMVNAQVRRLFDARMAVMFALVRLTESRDQNTGRHLQRVRNYSRALAATLAEDPLFRDQVDDVYVDNIFHASMLHDIGKVGIPDTILLKKGRLTPEEFEVMKTHTHIGARTLHAVRAECRGSEFIGMAIDIARAHHERWNGGGYPDGLKGHQIPLCARIVALADVYDAMRTSRPYKTARGHQEAVKSIVELSAVDFDPVVVNAFVEKAAVFESTHADHRDDILETTIVRLTPRGTAHAGSAE
jgi:putative two-component system response regulator